MTHIRYFILSLVALSFHLLSAANSPCDDFLCLHEGTCVINVNRQPHCQCSDIYFGQHCEYNSDTGLCRREPCKNGAKCGQHDDSATVNCFCVPGYHGSYCDLEYNECQSDPCMHGSCEDGVNEYTCKCEESWYGVHCNQKLGMTEPLIEKKDRRKIVAGVTAPLVVICCFILACLLMYFARRSVWWKKRRARVGDSHLELYEDQVNVKRYSLPLTQIRSRLKH